MCLVYFINLIIFLQFGEGVNLNHVRSIARHDADFVFIPVYAERNMQLPPEKSRHPVHNTKLIDLEHPYTQYKGIYYCVKKKQEG